MKDEDKKMKKIILKSLFSALILSSTLAVASPGTINAEIICPGVTSNGVFSITNYGDFIAGYGQRIIENKSPEPIYFKSSGSLASSISSNLQNYNNDSVSYESSTGRVSCYYKTNNIIDPSIIVSYDLTNGRGGIVMDKTNSTIRIGVPFGLKA